MQAYEVSEKKINGGLLQSETELNAQKAHVHIENLPKA